MAAKILSFRVRGAANIARARQARQECIRQHEIRYALAEVQWLTANADAADQRLSRVRSLQRIARAMLSVQKKQQKIEILLPTPRALHFQIVRALIPFACLYYAYL